MTDQDKNLVGIRVLAALNGMELFGHERGNIEVFKTLRDLGADVKVGVNAQPNNQVDVELRAMGFSTFPLPFGPQWSIQWVKKKPSIALTNFWAVMRCSLLFHRTIRSFHPTHVHLGSSLAYSYLLLALGLNKVPLVYRMGDSPPVDSPFNLRIWRMAMSRCDWLVANSEFVLKSATAADTSITKVSVINNLVPTRAETSDSPDPLPDNESLVSITYVGQVSEHKGLVPLIEAFSQLTEEYPFIQLEILGGSRYDTAFRCQLKKIIIARNIESRVILHGHVDDPSTFLKLSSIHVAPSIWEEPFANVVLEAKREGTPSVVFPSGGLPEMVRHQTDGFICRDKSVGALVDALRWMIEDPDRLCRLGVAAREDLGQRFGRQRFARAWAKIYQTVM